MQTPFRTVIDFHLIPPESRPCPMNSTRYLDASEVPICADSWTTTDNQGMTPLQRAPPPADAMDCRSLPPLSHYHRSRRCTPTPTRRSLALGDSFVANDPNTVRKVHELDAEALALQRKLEDDETHRKPSGRLPPVRPRAEQDSLGHRGHKIQAAATAGRCGQRRSSERRLGHGGTQP